MFTGALFTITKIWRQPKCPMTDEYIKKMWEKKKDVICMYICVCVYICIYVCVCIYIYIYM